MTSNSADAGTGAVPVRRDRSRPVSVAVLPVPSGPLPATIKPELEQ